MTEQSETSAKAALRIHMRALRRRIVTEHPEADWQAADRVEGLLGALGKNNDPILKLAMELEKIALEDDYFVSRKLYPNVDFYSGIVQRALGIPVSMFTCIFSLARTIGWIAQWQEMISDPEYKIGRPRQLYKGPTKRDVKPLDTR